jgi:hypothetical protein
MTTSCSSLGVCLIRAAALYIYFPASKPAFHGWLAGWLAFSAGIFDIHFCPFETSSSSPCATYSPLDCLASEFELGREMYETEGYDAGFPFFFSSFLLTLDLILGYRAKARLRAL